MVSEYFTVWDMISPAVDMTLVPSWVNLDGSASRHCWNVGIVRLRH